MYLLTEAIKIKDGIIHNIEYHNERLNSSRQELFKVKELIDLKNFINIPDDLKNDLVKCRIIYNEKIISIHFEKYKFRKVKTLKIVYSNTIDYMYKYEDKSEFNKLLALKNNYDDILIIKNNSITDTSFSNIIFSDKSEWITPLHPLLKGTKRQKLINENKIQEYEINSGDLKKFKKARLINAMIDFEDNFDIEINNIIP